MKLDTFSPEMTGQGRSAERLERSMHGQIRASQDSLPQGRKGVQR